MELRDGSHMPYDAIMPTTVIVLRCNLAIGAGIDEGLQCTRTLPYAEIT